MGFGAGLFGLTQTGASVLVSRTLTCVRFGQEGHVKGNHDVERLLYCVYLVLAIPLRFYAKGLVQMDPTCTTFEFRTCRYSCICTYISSIKREFICATFNRNPESQTRAFHVPTASSAAQMREAMEATQTLNAKPSTLSSETPCPKPQTLNLKILDPNPEA